MPNSQKSQIPVFFPVYKEKEMCTVLLFVKFTSEKGKSLLFMSLMRGNRLFSATGVAK